MNKFRKIISLIGEEKPGLICSTIKDLYNLPISFQLEPLLNDATSYNFNYEDKIIPYQICDSNGSSPDLIIKYEEGPNDFIEITKGSFRGSGNNSQYQRFTKFIPVLNTDMRLIYYFDTNDKDLIGKTKLAMKCWKKNKIDIKVTNKDLQTVIDNLETDFTLEEFAQEWNKSSKPSPFGKFKGLTQTISVDENIIHVKNFNVLKKDKITHDPGIGTIMLVLSTILQFRTNKTILISDHKLSQELINKSKRNKFIKFLCTLKHNFNTDIILENIELPDCDLEYSSLSRGSTSEKCVSIHDECILYQLGYDILYVNHARGEQEYFKIDGKECSINKTVFKPDIIYADKENSIIYFVEAERYCNYETGLKQIYSWRSDKTKEFYKGVVMGTPYENYKFKAYLTLYDSENLAVICDKRYVKKILNNKRVTYENENCEILDLF